MQANVFVGNPASAMPGFIARSRVALRLGNNHVYRARDEGGAWTTTCGDDCLFKYLKDGAHAIKLPMQSADVRKFKYAPPLKSRVSAELWKRVKETVLREREAETDTAKLRMTAHDSGMYNGLHPGEVLRYVRKEPVATRA